ncbi:unnamed protein product [Closterium sp. NIES-53]
MVMDVARTSMIHAAAPHFLWLFAVQYAAHQINLQPRVSLPETTPTLRWTGKVGDASVFRVWGSRALVRDTSADKLSSRAVPCVFLGFPPDAPGWHSSCDSEIYAGAMAAQELHWLAYLLTDLGEAPRSPPVLYVDNKAMLALCREHRLEHRTKHIALRYFLARELQQRGQLRLAYVASQANTADVSPRHFSLVIISLALPFLTGLVLQRFGIQFSSPLPNPLSIGHSLLAPPSDESVEPSGLYPELVGCLMYLMTCTRPDLVYPLSLFARYVAPVRHQNVHWDVPKRVLRYLCSTSGMGLVLGGQGSVVLTGHSDDSWADDQATQRSSQGYTFSLGSGSVSWRSTRSYSVLGSSCEAEIYAGAMAAQELRWLTYLLTDLGERPRSPPNLSVDNKAMLALCQEQRLEHRTKHIVLRYFLARELQQRRQLRLSYVASRANTADMFTKALGSGDHQRFCTALGLVPTLPHLLVA